jgi:hypothetical protein
MTTRDPGKIAAARKRHSVYKKNRSARLKQHIAPLTLERLKAVLHYDPGTGIFTRIAHVGTRCDLVGKEAGGKRKDTVRIAVDDRRYRAHRLAWFYMTGRWPDPEVDHKNRNPLDNRWENLREATSAINKHNRGAESRNKVGLLGVSPAPAGKFKARIDGRHLGVFDTPEEAHSAYLKEKRERHEGCLL